MTLQEMIRGLDELSQDEQASLFTVLKERLANSDVIQTVGDTFWEGVLRFRKVIEEEGLIFTDEDFADLRDRSLGREVDL